MDRSTGRFPREVSRSRRIIQGGYGFMDAKVFESIMHQPSAEVVTQLKSKIRNIPDFPIPGILFRDITPLLQDPQSFKLAIDAMAAPFQRKEIDTVVAIESRGYVLASAMAYQLGAGLVLIRKP